MVLSCLHNFLIQSSVPGVQITAAQPCNLLWAHDKLAVADNDRSSRAARCHLMAWPKPMFQYLHSGKCVAACARKSGHIVARQNVGP